MYPSSNLSKNQKTVKFSNAFSGVEKEKGSTGNTWFKMKLFVPLIFRKKAKT